MCDCISIIFVFICFKIVFIVFHIIIVIFVFYNQGICFILMYILYGEAVPNLTLFKHIFYLVCIHIYEWLDLLSIYILFSNIVFMIVLLLGTSFYH